MDNFVLCLLILDYLSHPFIAALLNLSLLISWLQSLFGLMTEPSYIKSITISISLLLTLKSNGSSVVMILVFLVFSCSFALALSSITCPKSCFKSLLSDSKMMLSAYLKLLIFLPQILTPPSEYSLAFYICSTYRLNG